MFFTVPAATGYVLGRGFGALADGDTDAVYRWALLLVVVEAVRMAAVHFGAVTWTKSWVHMQTLLRANLLTAQVASGGPEAGQPVGSAGEAITHFRDDTEDVTMFVDGMVDVSGGIGVHGARRPRARRGRRRRRRRSCCSRSVGVVLGDPHARRSHQGLSRRRPRRHGEGHRPRRRHDGGGDDGEGQRLPPNRCSTACASSSTAAGRPRSAITCSTRASTAFSTGAADVGLGLVLLVSAGAIASGAFDVGTLALFVAYLGWLSFLPRMIGRMLARHKQAGVAFDRMRRLVADADAGTLVLSRPLPIEARQRGVRPADRRPTRVPLQRLEVTGLAARYPGGAGIHDVSFRIDRGRFVVVTGPVGAGKSTMLRALLGLAWQAEIEGEVRWNGERLPDRAAFLVPPNAAFLPQVPQLVSDSVRDNVGLGPVPSDELARALALAAIDDDVAALPAGDATLIGPAASASPVASASAWRQLERSCMPPSWSCSTTSRARSTSRPSSCSGTTSPRPVSPCSRSRTGRWPSSARTRSSASTADGSSGDRAYGCRDDR